jgi:hypothetical protein
MSVSLCRDCWAPFHWHLSQPRREELPSSVTPLLRKVSPGPYQVLIVGNASLASPAFALGALSTISRYRFFSGRVEWTFDVAAADQTSVLQDGVRARRFLTEAAGLSAPLLT